MAQYTLTIKQIVENNINLFDFVYPVYDVVLKNHFEEIFISNFYFREIAFETVGKFKHNLKNDLKIKMPYFNKIYATTLLNQRILDNYDITETFEKTASNTNDTNTNTKNDSINLSSDTPMGRVDIATNDFVSNILKNNDTQLTEIKNIGAGVESWVRKMTGNIGVATDSDAIKNYIQNLVNFDIMLLESFNDLFMGVY